VTPVGRCPPAVSNRATRSHPDCRSPLILFVDAHGKIAQGKHHRGKLRTEIEDMQLPRLVIRSHYRNASSSNVSATT
jgi:hypothetical protein